MNKMKDISEPAHRWIEENAKARDKPLITMLELIRSKIINKIKDRYLAISKTPGPLCVKIKRILDVHIDECVGYTYIWNGRNRFQVKAHAEQYSV
ncbi:hypothetical protein LIER_33752 [Lithospermum erythrorhizon]|uniref:Uncharacterized protein n=1 Tax=Lithospermum erythrorhizon TaxID=34254 RepID=A0AAV3RZU0_LITER